jgi:NADPH:quinone reductase-like Zn-dependent oxidoreductase
VVVRLRAAALNWHDVLVRQGDPGAADAEWGARALGLCATAVGDALIAFHNKRFQDG